MPYELQEVKISGTYAASGVKSHVKSKDKEGSKGSSDGVRRMFGQENIQFYSGAKAQEESQQSLS